MPDWLVTCLDAAVFAAAFVAIYEGARRLLREGLGRVAILLLVLGLLPSLYEGVASLRGAAQVAALAEAMPPLVGEPRGGWENAALTPAQRSAQSLEAARLNFRVDGRLGPVIDSAGRRVPFVPQPDDLRERESLVAGRKGAQDAAARFEERGLQLLAGAAMVLLVGGLVGLVQRPRRDP